MNFGQKKFSTHTSPQIKLLVFLAFYFYVLLDLVIIVLVVEIAYDSPDFWPLWPMLFFTLFGSLLLCPFGLIVHFCAFVWLRFAFAVRFVYDHVVHLCHDRIEQL